jgi:hypothetical protein
VQQPVRAALDVEQIGSVYETVMGFTVESAVGRSLAIKAGKHNRPAFSVRASPSSCATRYAYLRSTSSPAAAGVVCALELMRTIPTVVRLGFRANEASWLGSNSALVDIVVWLRSLGLAKYEAAFRENEITEKVYRT